MKVSYLPYKEIDKEKWDKCMAASSNRLIYGFSFYLDAMAANWDGLVLNDYEAVMPLTWRKKFQVKYLYQPAFMQQGGIFSKKVITAEMISCFIEEASEQFKFAEITMNYQNGKIEHETIIVQQRKNYILLLDTYEKVFKNYDPAFTKSLRRLKKFNFRYEKSDNYSIVISLYKDLYGKRLPSFQEDAYKNLMSVCSLLAKEERVITRFALSPENKLLAAVVLLKDSDRLYNLISCITVEGKKVEANYFLYDNLIEEFSGNGLTLDLEGSEVNGIAAFYKKFNPLLQPYPFVKWNKLHPVLRAFKK